MRKTNIVILCLAFILVFSTASYAQEKIGVLDLSRTFDSYTKTKEFDKVLEEKSKAFEKDRNVKVEELKELQGKLALMKESEKEKVQKEFEKKRDEFVAWDQAQKTDLGKERDEKIREILLEIEKTVSDFAQKQKYDLVINDRVLIYGSETLDITEQILKILNDNYNKK